MQGLVTKDVTSLSMPDAAPLYAALLNTKGRLMADLLLHQEAGHSAGASLLLDCPATMVEQLKSNLTKFKLRAAVQVEDASSDLSIVARWSLGAPSISDINLPDPPGACSASGHGLTAPTASMLTHESVGHLRTLLVFACYSHVYTRTLSIVSRCAFLHHILEGHSLEVRCKASHAVTAIVTLQIYHQIRAILNLGLADLCCYQATWIRRCHPIPAMFRVCERPLSMTTLLCATPLVWQKDRQRFHQVWCKVHMYAACYPASVRFPSPLYVEVDRQADCRPSRRRTCDARSLQVDSGSRMAVHSLLHRSGPQAPQYLSSIMSTCYKASPLTRAATWGRSWWRARTIKA